MPSLHHTLDWEYGSDGGDSLREAIASGVDLEAREGPFSETPLHVATRRRRLDAVEILVDAGANIDAKTAGGKTAYGHAIRRGFGEIADLLRTRGADTALTTADELAVAVTDGRLDDARALIARESRCARTGNPEEDRLLADVAGRNPREPVELLIDAGADLSARGLDDGTPLHQSAWFGQPVNARILIHAGAPLDVFDSVHGASPIHWVAHGSRYSGDAESRQDDYVALMEMLLEAGASLYYPDEPENDAYIRRMLSDASQRVRDVLYNALGGRQ